MPVPDASPEAPSRRLARPRVWLDPDAVTLLVLVLVVVALHLPRFFDDRLENDERVYLALAREMSWMLENYSTDGDPLIRLLPSTIYREALYVHPPLLPFVLKVGRAVGQPVLIGLLFELAVAIAIVYLSLRAGRLIGLGPGERRLAATFTALCPILLVSTLRLHTDALLGALLLAGVVLFLESNDTGSLLRSAAAGLAFALALNARYSGLIALPVLALAQGSWLLWRWRRDGSAAWTDSRSWRSFLVAAPVAAALGLPHYLRVLTTYGHLLPTRIYRVETERLGPMFDELLALSRAELVLWLLLLVPVWLLVPLLVARRSAGDDATRGRWRLFALAGATVLALVLTFIPEQLRYYASVSPWLHLVAARAPDPRSRLLASVWRGLVALTLFSMAVSSLDLVVRLPPILIPLPVRLLGLFPYG